MKHYYTILILAYSLFNPIYAQDCSTPDLSEAGYYALPWYDNEDFLPAYYDSLENAMNSPAFRTASPGDIESPWLRVPIKFWVYQNSNVDPGGAIGSLPNDLRIQRIMDKLNTSFRDNGIKFRFYLECVSYVSKASAVRVVGFNEKLSLAIGYRNNTAINVHIVDDLDDATGSTGEFNSLYDAIFITRSVALDSLGAETLPHEIGHYFGLQHTFAWYGVPCLWEPVARGYTFSFGCTNFRKQCAKTGDLLCDTNADPNMDKRGVYNSEACSYDAQGTKDYQFRTYHPNPTNYMAYGNRGCRDQFTEGQQNVMYRSAFWNRRALAAYWTLKGSNKFDIYEPDNAAIAARSIVVGETQRHSFHSAGCNDTSDWLSFTYQGSINRYQIITYPITGQNNPVNEVRMYNPITAGNAGARITNITSTISNGVRTIDIPCSALTIGNTYLIEVRRGNNNIGQYEIELIGDADIGSIKLSGSNIVCASGNTYTLSNIPSGATIQWSKSSNLVYVSGQGTASYKVSANGTGSGFVKATLTGSCGDKKTFKKNVWINKPNYTINLDPIGNYVNIELQGVGGSFTKMGVTTIVWTKLAGTGVLSISGETGLAHGSDYNWYIDAKVAVTNTCGTTTKYITITPPAPLPCETSLTGSNYKILPEQAKNSYGAYIIIDPCMDVSLTTTSNNTQQIDVKNDITVVLTDIYGTKHSEFKYKSAHWNFNSTPPGMYIIGVYIEGEYVVERIMIE